MNARPPHVSSKIRYESELVLRFRELLTEDPDLEWRFERLVSQREILTLRFDGVVVVFDPVYELKPSVSWIQNLREIRGAQPLLVTPQLSHRVLETCRKHGISAIDLNGRAWLRAQGILIHRSALPDRAYRYELEPRDIFVGKSSRIVRLLLTNRDREWKQAEIARQTWASPGLVSRIVKHLIAEGFAEKISAFHFRLRDPSGLLDAWAAADQFNKRVHTTRYAGFLDTPLEIAGNLESWARARSISLAFTQWIAAWIRHPYTEPVLCSAYISRLPDPGELQELGLREVSEGGKLCLYVPEDSGVLFQTELHKGIPLTTDAQIYVDLQRTGLRGPDAAAALREWEGFCRQ